MVMASMQLTVILVLCTLHGLYVLEVESLHTNGFSDRSILLDTNIQSTFNWSTIGSPRQWVFPSINFTCTGTRIIGWAFRARYNQFGNAAMLMQIWRYDETEDLYRRVQSTGSLNELVSPDNQAHEQSYVYEYNLTSPITVEKNDLFGLEWANTNERTQLEMWDVGDGNAPTSYRVQWPANKTSPNPGRYVSMIDRRFLPLVSVIVEDNLGTTTTVALMLSLSSQLAPAPTTHLSLPISSINTPATTNPPIGSGEEGESSIPAAAIAGASSGGGVLVAVGVVAAIVIILVCVLLRKKDKGNRAVGPTEENAAYGNKTVNPLTVENVNRTMGETIATEENTAYGNRTVGGPVPIDLEENAAYGGTMWRDSHSQTATTLTIQPDELNEYEDTVVMEPEYMSIEF